MGYLKRLKTSGSVSLEAFKMYYAMRASAPSLHRESTDSLIYVCVCGGWGVGGVSFSSIL